ncbi:hypothetical protein, partial [Acinetobacter baumannii]|uniref:hypothetical protein n=1 Tax=Acinetobacter baumannii TaxID=470 RepID=UPI0012E1045B
MVLKKSEKFVEFDSFWLIFDNGFFDKQNMHQKQKVAITNLETIFLGAVVDKVKYPSNPTVFRAV